jgi:hypothetical protein
MAASVLDGFGVQPVKDDVRAQLFEGAKFDLLRAGKVLCPRCEASG